MSALKLICDGIIDIDGPSFPYTSWISDCNVAATVEITLAEA